MNPPKVGAWQDSLVNYLPVREFGALEVLLTPIVLWGLLLIVVAGSWWLVRRVRGLCR